MRTLVEFEHHIRSKTSGKPLLATGIVKRSHRAAIRIMYDYNVPEEEIAAKYNRSVKYVLRIATNDISTPDSVEDDYSHVDEETKKLYPPRVSMVVLCDSDVLHN
jgi:hypothetical protein